ncbi:hypothetical protein [Neorhodopirellula lusitana]|uniref:hypothetical protein n=1 Tax=Neorhodopirellula lusitana TaxID=445327 RepID=UPI00384E0FFE
MKRKLLLTCVAVFASGFAMLAIAQEPRGGGPVGRPKPGEILPEFLRQALNLTDRQSKQLSSLQTMVDGRLEKLLTDEQRQQLESAQPPGGGPEGPGGAGRPGGVGGPGDAGGLSSSSPYADEEAGPPANGPPEGGPPGGGPPPGQGRPGFGPPGGGPSGGGPPRGGPGGGGRGPGGPPQPGEILPSFVKESLNLTIKQTRQLEALQRTVTKRLTSILTLQQQQQLMRGGPQTEQGSREGGPSGRPQ